MARARKICNTRGCTNLQPCPEHAPKPWAGSQRRERMTRKSGSAQQRVARAVMLKHDGVCHVCGQHGANQVDHVIPVSQGGSDHMSNLRPIHAEPCHREKTARETRAVR